MSPPNHDEAIQQLVADFRKGYLTRRGFLAQAAAFGLTAAGLRADGRGCSGLAGGTWDTEERYSSRLPAGGYP